MLNELGEPIIGHGVIKEFSEELMIAQLQKRNFDMESFDKLILEEYRNEQPSFYRMMEHTASRYATQFADMECIGGTANWQESVNYWKQRLMFLLALQYKIISVGIECQEMEEK